MKKGLFLLLFVFLLGCGTAETDQKATKTESKGEAKTMASATSTPIEEERTVDFKGEEPWKRNAAVRLQSLINEGETVYLWSDAEAFEDKVLTVIDYVPPKSNAVNAPDPKKQRSDAFNSTNDHIKVFVGELSKRHEDKKGYFNLLTQAGEALANGDTETAKAKIEEAKTIRESE
ncbi:hypothetical protein ACQCVB_20245 [Fictibacillus phosphorivorans]|uniref:hypothetical protein n=1 Tax=Fictibacillus phosphorivorans TaxID=1221500 RepID=UPI003CED5D07